jgi:CRISPR-associated Csx2 family protein
MHKTLLTFLGKGRDSAKTGYRVANYRFPDGLTRQSAFFGLALAEVVKPDLLVMLGTTGSMWGVLVEHVAVEGEDEALRLELMEAEYAGQVDQPLLDRVAPLLRRAAGIEVLPRLIPSGRSAQEQVEMLSTIASSVPKSTQLQIDVTHGFRHLGMVGFLSAELLQRLRAQTEVHAVWYGALDMTQDQLTPVLALDGLQSVQRWVSALDRFDASNDYGVFAPLLEADGLPRDKAQCLVDAAFFENMSNVADAARRINTVLSALDAPLRGPSELFRQTLRKRLEWARKNDLGEQQRLLALRALDRGDLLRAAIFGLESLITRLCQEQGKDPLDYRQRAQTDEVFQQELKEGAHPDWKRDAYRKLKKLRNAMAHGTSPESRSLQELQRNPQRLREELRSALSRLSQP